MKLLWELFVTFFKIGLVTFGGGYAMLPLIENYAVEQKKWIKSEDILNIFAISQSIPGAIAINTATIIGFKTAKKAGAICATIGIITPSYIIIVLFANLITLLQHNDMIDSMFAGINGAVAALIFIAAFKIIRSSIKTNLNFLIMLVCFVGMMYFKINPIYLILCFIVVSVLHYTVLYQKSMKNVGHHTGNDSSNHNDNDNDDCSNTAN